MRGMPWLGACNQFCCDSHSMPNLEHKIFSDSTSKVFSLLRTLSTCKFAGIESLQQVKLTPERDASVFSLNLLGIPVSIAVFDHASLSAAGISKSVEKSIVVPDEVVRLRSLHLSLLRKGPFQSSQTMLRRQVTAYKFNPSDSDPELTIPI